VVDQPALRGIAQACSPGGWLMLELYGGVYLGWNVKHFHEHLVRDHGFRWGYTWVKTQLHTAGLVERARRRGAHRRKRERNQFEGMMWKATTASFLNSDMMQTLTLPL
jgi:hypothetical protein